MGCRAKIKSGSVSASVTTVSSEYHCGDVTSKTWKFFGILSDSRQLDVHKSTDVPAYFEKAWCWLCEI